MRFVTGLRITKLTVLAIVFEFKTLKSVCVRVCVCVSNHLNSNKK